MDWVTGLQNAIDYMEEHLLEELDYDAIAAKGFSSSYHFQRRNQKNSPLVFRKPYLVGKHHLRRIC